MRFPDTTAFFQLWLGLSLLLYLLRTHRQHSTFCGGVLDGSRPLQPFDKDPGHCLTNFGHWAFGFLVTLGAKAITPLLTVPSAVGYQFEIHVSRLVLSLHEHRLLLLVTFCGGVIGFRSIYSDWNHRRSSSWISSPCLWQLVHWALSGTRVITPFIFASAVGPSVIVQFYLIIHPVLYCRHRYLLPSAVGLIFLQFFRSTTTWFFAELFRSLHRLEPSAVGRSYTGNIGSLQAGLGLLQSFNSHWHLLGSSLGNIGDQ